jgi:hypothetical protein
MCYKIVNLWFDNSGIHFKFRQHSPNDSVRKTLCHISCLVVLCKLQRLFSVDIEITGWLWMFRAWVQVAVRYLSYNPNFFHPVVLSLCQSSGRAVWCAGLDRSYTGYRVRIPLEAWMFVLDFLCCVVLCRWRPCDELITRPRSPTICRNRLGNKK